MSSINPNNIDGTYPIAGQDNDSQGFRDNFTNIKNNFTFAYDELADLQSKAVLKSALNGSTLDNTLSYTSLNTSGNILATGAKVFGNATLGLAGVISGQFHTVVGNITQTSSGGAVYINTTGNVLATGLTVFGNTTHGLAGAVSGQFHSFVGNITQTSSGGAVYINTTGNLLVGGNVTLAGGQRETGYQFSAPTANVAVTALPTKSRLLLTPTGAIISFGANVTLPGGNVDGATYSISSNVATTLAVYGQDGISVSPGANVQLTAGTSVSYLYYATDTKWYKIS